MLGGLAGEVAMWMACSPQQAWDLITDVTRIGEFSPECTDAWWVSGYPTRAVGARFEGHNRSADGAEEWIRPCDVTAWDEPRHFAWVVGDRYDGSPATRWSYTLEPDGADVVVRHSFAHDPQGQTGVRIAVAADPDRAGLVIETRRRHLLEGMTRTLERMRAILECDGVDER